MKVRSGSPAPYKLRHCLAIDVRHFIRIDLQEDSRKYRRRPPQEFTEGSRRRKDLHRRREGIRVGAGQNERGIPINKNLRKILSRCAMSWAWRSMKPVFKGASICRIRRLLFCPPVPRNLFLRFVIDFGIDFILFAGASRLQLRRLSRRNRTSVSSLGESPQKVNSLFSFSTSIPSSFFANILAVVSLL